MGFIKSRLNKDNFWNLMCWAFITLCTMLSEYFNNIKLVEYSFLCFSILGVPFIIKQIQDVKFDKKYGFFNSNGRSLKDSQPKHLIFAIVFSIGLILSIGFIKNRLFPELNTTLSTTLYWSIFLLIPTLYFILINCPISLLFNKNAFKPISPAESARLNVTSDYIHDPKYSFMSCNMYNHHRKHRH